LLRAADRWEEKKASLKKGKNPVEVCEKKKEKPFAARMRGRGEKHACATKGRFPLSQQKSSASRSY